jgi:hypothetical protein
MSTKPTVQLVEEELRAKPFSVSHTKLSGFRRCLQAYHWKYIDGFYPPSSSGQARGTAGHAALAVWHTDYDAQKALNTAWEAWEANGQSQGPDWDILEASLDRYFQWSLQQQDTFKVLVAEQEFNIEFEMDKPYWLPSKKEPGKRSEARTFILNGFIDGIVEDHGYLWLLENKFYKRMDNGPLDLDPQVSIYLLAALLVGFEERFGKKLQGVIYNIVRVADGKKAVEEPAVRRKLSRNAEGLSRIQEEIFQQVQRMIAYHQKGGDPYRNPTKDCHWDCSFYNACLLYQDDGNYPKDQLIRLSQTRSTQNGKTEETADTIISEQGE